VSHKPYIGLLAHHEPHEARPTSHIPADQAELLVDRLFAERISRTKIRMLHPDSVFMTAERDRSILDRLPATLIKVATTERSGQRCVFLGSAEIPGLIFQPPDSDRIKRQLRAPIIREAWEAWQTQLLTQTAIASTS